MKTTIGTLSCRGNRNMSPKREPRQEKKVGVGRSVTLRRTKMLTHSREVNEVISMCSQSDRRSPERDCLGMRTLTGAWTTRPDVETLATGGPEGKRTHEIRRDRGRGAGAAEFAPRSGGR